MWTFDEKTLVGSAVTDDLGVCKIPLDKAPWRAYPVSAVLKLFKGDEQLGWPKITAQGVSGVYPDNLWRIFVPDEKSLPRKGQGD